MQTIFKAIIAVGILTVGFFAQAYTLESSVTQVPLIELYTSEGCNSCPPADKWLAQIAKSNLIAITLAFHVDYWDNLGWKDVFATPQAQGTARQHALASRNLVSFVYTPEIFTDFEENKFWHDKSKFIAYVQESNKKIASAKIVVKGVLENKELNLNVLLESKLGSSLYLALYENALSSRVLNGENSGLTFTHERVVRKLIGPYLVDKFGRLSKDVIVGLDGIRVESAGVVLFSQNANGRFEQALDYPFNSKK